jgi:hypothetical protein
MERNDLYNRIDDSDMTDFEKRETYLNEIEAEKERQERESW